MQFCKKTAVILCTILLAAALAACHTNAPNSGRDPAAASAEGGKLFSEPTEISIVVGSHPSWPYNENWKLWHYFQEATGADFQVQAIPNTELNTKVSLMMASPDTLPDLIYVDNKPMVDQHAMDGALVALTDHMDEMPYFSAYLASLPESERTEVLAQRKSGDGKVYFAPVTGTNTVANLRTWMYRKDIFEKHSLTPPETMEELYQTAKQLKEIYPSSYPLCFRSGLQQIAVMGPSWKNDFDYGPYYDFQAGAWRYGAQEGAMLEMIQFFRRMHTEGLVPPDFLTITSKSWEELVSTDRGFIMPEYIVRIDFFNLANREQNADYAWAGMLPPKADTPQGQNRIAKLNVDPSGYIICNTGKKGRMQNALRLVDWMYSDEGSLLLSWGKENETYTKDADGKKAYILPHADDTPQQLYGIMSYGLYQRFDPDASEAAYTEEQNAYGRKAYTYTEDHANPRMWLALNGEEQKVRDTLYDAIINYTDENLSKFLLGQKPVSEWDGFQAGLVEMGVEELLAMYDSAYRRTLE